MRFLFILLIVLTAGAAQAQSTKKPTIIDNLNPVLARYGWENRIKWGAISDDGHQVSAQFVSIADKNFVLNGLKQSKDFKESDGMSILLWHRGALKTFREQSEPSMHIVWYENKIEIHFDLHCPGWTHPLKSYKHFREVFTNLRKRSYTSQEKIARRLQNDRQAKSLLLESNEGY
ncbi:MAG: hypothetical protein ACR2N3_19095 [Pyrinomonadaceae bacterium]